MRRVLFRIIKSDKDFIRDENDWNKRESGCIQKETCLKIMILRKIG